MCDKLVYVCAVCLCNELVYVCTLCLCALVGIEDQDNWHGKPLGAKADAALAHLQSLITSTGPSGLSPAPPAADVAPVNISNIRLSTAPAYKLGDKVATRAAYGTALVKIGANNNRVVALDAEVKNSTFSIKFKVSTVVIRSACTMLKIVYTKLVNAEQE